MGTYCMDSISHAPIPQRNSSVRRSVELSSIWVSSSSLGKYGASEASRKVWRYAVEKLTAGGLV